MNTYSFSEEKLSSYELKNAPDILYYEGDISLIDQDRRVSVVGSRKATREGIQRATYLTKKLIEHNIIVVSGLALGIDTVAHKTAINQNGKTIAVLGTPLDQVSPKENSELLEEIKSYHLAVSQFAKSSTVYRSNFPLRNKTMALLSDATIIIEASENSGTKHQGWEAIRLGRKLYILENVAKNGDLSWPNKMIEYGAVVLTKDNLEEELRSLPSFTEEYAISF